MKMFKAFLSSFRYKYKKGDYNSKFLVKKLSFKLTLINYIKKEKK